jgi:eukaryotic-like serine/threonine-protein kinase
MTEPSSAPDPDEAILLQFQREYEAADDKDAVLRGYCGRHERLAPRLRARVAMLPVLGGLEPERTEPLPERFGEFRVIREIGHGGMGRVYEARYERLNRRVAVKTIRPDRASPVAIDRFHREQRALARLHQTHIVSIFEAGEEGPVQYFAMPYIDGAALSHVVQTALHRETLVPHSQTPSLAKLAAHLAAEQEMAVRGSTAGPSSGRPIGAATAPVLPPEVRTARLVLSAEYFRSVAEAMADAAEAIQHAHEAGLLHRDVKPSNLMVDRAGHCWVIDFGLAGEAPRRDGEGRPTDSLLSADAVTSTGVLGTPQYMAPEQWTQGKGGVPLDARTDVYGLGVTLYELLTLRRAFDGATNEAICAAVLRGEMVSPRNLVGNAPADLAAVCRKAMQKESGSRYASAKELAEDLRRWLRHEPTQARGAGVGLRLWLWARRNPGWAVAGVVGLLAIATLSVGAGLYHERRQEAERQSLIRRAENIRTKHRSQGWRENAWELQRKAAKIRSDDLLRTQAAATLAGIDAHTEKAFGTFDVPWLTFDPKGERLLMSGGSATRLRPASGARVWNLEKDELTDPLNQAEAGPVAFRPDGSPVQLVPEENVSLRLWDVAKRATIKEFHFSEQFRKQEGWSLARSASGLAVLAVSQDSSLVAASAVDAKGNGLTVVWDVATGKPVLEAERSATAVSFAPSGTLVATGDSEGNVALWSLPQGKPAGKFRASRMPVYSLAFSQDARTGKGADGAGQWRHRGRLAVGGAGGGLVIWDLQENLTWAICHGSRWDVYTAAFSPDGMLLASAGRDHVHLWDSATGALLLSCAEVGFITSLAFSPVGNLLAVGSHTVFAGGGAIVRRLEDGRGVRTLRGLTQPVVHVSLSQDSRRIAALAHNWEVVVWDLPQGRLRNRFQAPRGLTADNAGLSLSRDGRRVAFATSGGARLWDIESGKELGAWELPRGIVDRLAFDDKDRLLLFRAERENDRPVCRVRNLLGADALKPVAEIRDFDVRILDAVLTPDGARVVVAGLNGPGKDRWLRAYATMTGKELWSQKMPDKLGFSLLVTDPEGKILSVGPGTEPGSNLLADVATGKRVDAMPHSEYGLSLGARYAMGQGMDAVNGANRRYRN